MRDLSRVVRRTPRDTPAPLYTRTSPWPNKANLGGNLQKTLVLQCFRGAPALEIWGGVKSFRYFGGGVFFEVFWDFGGILGIFGDFVFFFSVPEWWSVGLGSVLWTVWGQVAGHPGRPDLIHVQFHIDWTECPRDRRDICLGKTKTLQDVSDFFFFFLLGEGEGGVRGARGGVSIFIEIPMRGGGGGLQEGEGSRGREGVCSVACQEALNVPLS